MCGKAVSACLTSCALTGQPKNHTKTKINMDVRLLKQNFWTGPKLGSDFLLVFAVFSLFWNTAGWQIWLGGSLFVLGTTLLLKLFPKENWILNLCVLIVWLMCHCLKGTLQMHWKKDWLRWQKTLNNIFLPITKTKKILKGILKLLFRASANFIIL